MNRCCILVTLDLKSLSLSLSLSLIGSDACICTVTVHGWRLSARGRRAGPCVREDPGRPASEPHASLTVTRGNSARGESRSFRPSRRRQAACRNGAWRVVADEFSRSVPSRRLDPSPGGRRDPPKLARVSLPNHACLTCKAYKSRNAFCMTLDISVAWCIHVYCYVCILKLSDLVVDSTGCC